ncbi:MAG: DUF72 domain-containing protein [Actinomycetota bacterium]
MTAVFRVGCPMWAHPPWVGTYLSPARRGRELADYATWCNAVEGNTTFYATPPATTVERWADQAPAGFRFAFKAPRTVTHDRRLRPEAHRDLAELLRVVSPLGERIGPVQLQLPPTFGPESTSTLIDFVRRLPRSHRWVVEFRHRAFFDGGPAHRRVDETLADLGMGRVVLDTRPLYARPATTPAAADERRTKPSLPVVTDVMGDAPIVRIIGNDDPTSTLAGFDPWREHVVDWIEDGREPFAFVHQPENLTSPEIARAIHAQVAERSDIDPLPDPAPVDEPRLF